LCAGGAYAQTPYEPAAYPDLLRIKDMLALAENIEAYYKKKGHYPLASEPQAEMQKIAITDYRDVEDKTVPKWKLLEEELARELGEGVKIRLDPSEGQQGMELRFYRYATDGQDYYVAATLSSRVFYAREIDKEHYFFEISSRPNGRDFQYSPRQVRHYMKHGPDNVDRQINLASAIGRKDFAGVKELVEKGANLSPPCEFSTRCVPLADAARAGDLETMRFLIDMGADVNAFTAYYDVPLTSALGNKQNEAAKLLLEKGAGVNFPNAFGITPFIGALGAGNIEMAKLMLEKGANVNRRYLAFNSETKPGDMGERPLEAAIHSRKAELVEMLLKAGADATLTGHAGTAMLDLANASGDSKIVALVKGALKK